MKSETKKMVNMAFKSSALSVLSMQAISGLWKSDILLSSITAPGTSTFLKGAVFVEAVGDPFLRGPDRPNKQNQLLNIKQKKLGLPVHSTGNVLKGGKCLIVKLEYLDPQIDMKNDSWIQYEEEYVFLTQAGRLTHNQYSFCLPINDNDTWGEVFHKIQAEYRFPQNLRGFVFNGNMTLFPKWKPIWQPTNEAGGKRKKLILPAQIEPEEADEVVNAHMFRPHYYFRRDPISGLQVSHNDGARYLEEVEKCEFSKEDSLQPILNAGTARSVAPDFRRVMRNKLNKYLVMQDWQDFEPNQTQTIYDRSGTEYEGIELTITLQVIMK